MEPVYPEAGTFVDCTNNRPSGQLQRPTWRAALVSRVIMDDCPAQSPIAVYRAAPEMRDARAPASVLSDRLAARASRRRPLVAILLAATMLLSGCTSLRQWWHNGYKVGPNYCPPPAPVAAGWIEEADSHIDSSRAVTCDWWALFGDPTLNELIETAYRQNLDLRTAGTRILEARAQRNIAAGNLFPQSQRVIGGLAHGQVSKNLALPLPSTLNVWATGLNASWEIDFWGRYRRSIEAADADLGAAEEGYRDALVLLLSEVATSYVQLRTYEERLAFAQKNVEVQQGSTRLAETRFKNGTATELDMRQARSNLAQTEALIPPLVIGRRQASNQLCILLGMPPGDLASQLAPGPIPVAPVTAAVGIPAEMLRRRPDVRQAEREIAAQSARIGVAQADLYPQLGVNGFLGYAASDLKNLFAANSATAVILPSFQWNILNYGRITNNVRVQDARFERAVLQYQQTVLSAGREVEDALVGFIQSQQQAARLADSVREADRSVQLVMLQFEGGVTDFNRVYNTQGLLVTQQDQLASTRGNIAINLIQVFRSLGGGWQYFSQHQVQPAVVALEELPPPNQGNADEPALIRLPAN